MVAAELGGRKMSKRGQAAKALAAAAVSSAAQQQQDAFANMPELSIDNIMEYLDEPVHAHTVDPSPFLSPVLYGETMPEDGSFTPLESPALPPYNLQQAAQQAVVQAQQAAAAAHAAVAAAAMQQLRNTPLQRPTAGLTPGMTPVTSGLNGISIAEDSTDMTPLVSPALKPTYDLSKLSGAPGGVLMQPFLPLTPAALIGLHQQQQQIQQLQELQRAAMGAAAATAASQAQAQALNPLSPPTQGVAQSGQLPSLPRRKSNGQLSRPSAATTPSPAAEGQTAAPGTIMGLFGSFPPPAAAPPVEQEVFVAPQPVRRPSAPVAPVASRPPLISPALPPQSPRVQPVDPSSTFSPLVSPALRPDRRAIASARPVSKPPPTAQSIADVAQQLETKSNYQAMLEGQWEMLGFAPELVKVVEDRRNTHKVSEKKRRDDLKYGFDELRNLIPAGALPPPNKGNPPSKAAILKKTVDYIRYLHGQRKRMSDEINRLRAQLGEPSTKLDVSWDGGAAHDGAGPVGMETFAPNGSAEEFDNSRDDSEMETAEHEAPVATNGH